MIRRVIPLFFLIIVSACQDQEPEYPSILTGMVTEINSTGATFMVRITDLGEHECSEYGFVWGATEDPTYENSEKYIFPYPPETGDFSKRVSTTLLNNVTYYVRAFIRQGNVLIYGSSTEFISEGSGKPQIELFYPAEANVGDSVTIVGNDFSYILENNQVHFGVLEAELISAVQDTLKVIVPEELAQHQSTLSVSVNGHRSTFPEQFVLIKPEILDFAPKSGPFGSIITVQGAHFGQDQSKIKVRFGGQLADIQSTSENEISVRLPYELDSALSYVSVEKNNLKAFSPEPFTLVLPAITAVSPTLVTFGTSVTLSGSLLDSNPDLIKVKVDGIEAEITDMNSGEITFTVPDEVNARTLTPVLDINGLQILSPADIFLSDLVLTEYYPGTVNTGQTITINGEGFSPVALHNRVMIGNVMGEVTSAGNTSLEVLVPYQDDHIYDQRELTLSVEVIGQEKSFVDPVIINDPWFRLADAPVESTYHCIQVQAGSKVYIGLWDTNSFWSYDIETRSWETLAEFPGATRRDPAAFLLNGNIYFGTGGGRSTNFGDLWIYSIENNTWSQTEDFPGEPGYGFTAFSIDNKAYLVGGIESASTWYPHPYSGCWEYDPAENTWTRTSMLDYVGYSNAGVQVINNLAYYGLGNSTFQGSFDQFMYLFDPNSPDGYWTLIPLFPEERSDRPVCFGLNEFPYFAAGRDFYYYDNEWIPVQTGVLTDIRGGVGFSYNGIGYAGLGSGSAMWEYDPSR